MELSDIQKNWTDKNLDRQANLAAWNSMAERYNGEVTQPAWDSDPFLMQLDREVALSNDMSALDIGCGTGRYSAALANRVGTVTGIDISPKMLSHAETLAKTMGIKNAEFICMDFCEVNTDRKFDLVFAHLTPAISSANTFSKMLSLSSDYCYLVKPVHRIDPVFDAVKKLAGHNDTPAGSDKGLYYALSMLWQMGILPTLGYYPAKWKMEKSLDEAKAWYINRLKSLNEIDSQAERRAIEYLEEIAVDDKVHETISTTVATMGWRMTKGENK